MIRLLSAASVTYPTLEKAKIKPRIRRFTAREGEVLALVAHGRSNREIANTLGIAEKTARIHVSNILAKIGVADRTQAAIAAIQRGLVHFE